MEAQEARDKTIAAVKETIEAVTQVGKSHISVRFTDISDDVKAQMESEGYKFEILENQLVPKGKRFYVENLYKISW